MGEEVCAAGGVLEAEAVHQEAGAWNPFDTFHLCCHLSTWVLTLLLLMVVLVVVVGATGE